MLKVITRGVSRSITDCQLTFLPRQPIDPLKARQQHQAYESLLREMGAEVISLPVEPDLPDAVFVEDTSVVVDEMAVITRMGAVKRRPEAQSVAPVLSQYRPLQFINSSGTLEGGDVIRVGRTLYVGVSGRTSHDGIAQLQSLLRPYDYQVKPVEVKGCLHLSTGCCYAGRHTMLVNRSWIDASALDDFDLLDVPESEAWAANIISIDDTVLVSASFPETKALLDERGFRVRTIDISELEKAEAGLTCMSIVFAANGTSRR